MVQQVKDPALSLECSGFDPWPGNFHMLQEESKRKRGEKKVNVHLRHFEI